MFKFFIDGMWVVAIALANETYMSGAMVHLLVVMLLTSGWYFSTFLLRVCGNFIITISMFINCIVTCDVDPS